MAALNNADADGRILVDCQAGTLKFVLLNAAAHFAKVRSSQHDCGLAVVTWVSGIASSVGVATKGGSADTVLPAMFSKGMHCKMGRQPASLCCLLPCCDVKWPNSLTCSVDICNIVVQSL